MKRVGEALVLLCCLTVTVGYTGAVTGSAVVGFVVPSVVACAATVALTRLHPIRGAVLGIAVALGWSVAVKALSGDYNGPAARSSFVAGTMAALTLFAVRTRWPWLFVLPLVGLMCGALALGAGGEVGLPAVIAAGLAVVALAAVEHDDRHVLGQRWSWLAPGLVIAALVSSSAVGAILVQGHYDSRSALVLLRGSNAVQVAPRFPDPLRSQEKRAQEHQPSVATPAPTTSPNTVAIKASGDRVPTHRARKALLALCGFLAFCLLLATARLALVGVAWRRAKRRLRRGEPNQSALGAWVWTRVGLARQGLELAQHASPDVVARDAARLSCPPSLQGPIAALARDVVPIAYGPGARSVSREEAERLWREADELLNLAKRDPSLHRRFASRWATPDFGTVAAS